MRESTAGATPQHMQRTTDVDCLKYLVEMEMAPTDQLTHDGRTPLYMACQSGHADCVRFLLREASADPFLCDKTE